MRLWHAAVACGCGVDDAAAKFSTLAITDLDPDPDLEPDPLTDLVRFKVRSSVDVDGVRETWSSAPSRMLCVFLFVEKVLHRRPDPVLVVFHRGVFLQAREKDVRVRACVRACVRVRACACVPHCALWRVQCTPRIRQHTFCIFFSIS